MQGSVLARTEAGELVKTKSKIKIPSTNNNNNDNSLLVSKEIRIPPPPPTKNLRSDLNKYKIQAFVPEQTEAVQQVETKSIQKQKSGQLLTARGPTSVLTTAVTPPLPPTLPAPHQARTDWLSRRRRCRRAARTASLREPRSPCRRRGACPGRPRRPPRRPALCRRPRTGRVHGGILGNPGRPSRS